MGTTDSAIQPEKSIRRSPEAMEPDFAKMGNNLVTKFHVLMRISRTYDSKNVALSQFIQESLKTINEVINKEGSFALKIIRDDLYLNEQRLRYSVEGFTSFKYILNQWKKRFIGEVIFKEAADESTLRAFIYTLVELEEGREDNATLFNEKMGQQGIASIRVNALESFEGEDGVYTARKADIREVSKKIFFETIGTIKEVMTQIRGDQHADVRKLKRLVQKTIHLIMEDESILLGLTTIKNYDEYTYNHSVNVSIYSLAIGRRLGFSRDTLTELGMTGLFHDVGKSMIPKEILNKPAALDQTEWVLMKKHPLMGVETVLNLKQLGEVNPKMVIGIFDHHLKYDLSGYPRLFQKKKVSLFGRILQIADAYDAMTTPRVYKKNPYTLDQTLAIMLKDSGGHFDPTLLKIFIALVGVYPVGSLVLLDSGELGIVSKPNPDPKWIERPQVILLSRDGKEEGTHQVIDLTETDGKENFRWGIVKTLDPNQYHIDIAKYFL
jgi:HD-GYP domain-containing protein (c-di-GMP phosphodiesterase class II)